jgi:hypothetical protein
LGPTTVRERIPNPRTTLMVLSTACSFLGKIFPAIDLHLSRLSSPVGDGNALVKYFIL